MKFPTPARRSHLFALAAAGLLAPAITIAAEPATQNFDIPSQALSSALTRFSAATGLQVLYEGDIAEHITAPELKGAYNPVQALQKLLRGSGLNYRFSSGNTVTLEQAAVVEPQSANALPAVTVVGKGIYDVDAPDNPDYNRSNATTATKTDTPIMETPFSIKTVPQQVMKDQQAVRLEQALENVSGVTSTRTSGASNGAQSATMIRGFQTYEFYRDGSRFPGAWVWNGPRELANIEQVEVLKGPASILYGRLEPGGLVNLVTKKPSATPYYSLQQQFGSFDFYRTTADATGAISKDKSLLYRVNLDYENAGSFRDFVSNERGFLAPTFHWQISDRTEANVHLEYQHNRSTPDNGLFAVGNRPVNLPRERYLGEPGSKFESESFVAGLDWSHAFSDNWSIRHRFDITSVLKNEGSPYALPYDETGCTPGSCPVGRFGLANKNPANVYYTTLDLLGNFKTWGIKHSFLFGGDYQRMDDRYRSSFGFPITSIDAYQPVYNGIDPKLLTINGGFNLNEEWFGLYAQDQIELPHHIHLLAGFRYDNARVSNHNLDGGTEVVSTTRATPIKPRVGILYQPIPEVSVYGNYVENFGIQNGVNFADNSPLPPTTAEQWEAGVKTELFDKRLTTTFAWFDITKQNIAIPIFGRPGYREVVGEARNRGLEFDISGELLPGWKVIGAYSYIDSKMTKDAAGVQGNKLWNVPRNTGSLWTTYEFLGGDLQGLKFGGGVQVRDQRQGDKANSFQLPGYATVNLMTSYTMKVAGTRLTTQFNVNNLLDKWYYDSAAGWSDRTQGIMPGEPRNFMGSVRVEF
jgi:iron complex outermembrane receptor protein